MPETCCLPTEAQCWRRRWPQCCLLQNRWVTAGGSLRMSDLLYFIDCKRSVQLTGRVYEKITHAITGIFGQSRERFCSDFLASRCKVDQGQGSFLCSEHGKDKRCAQFGCRGFQVLLHLSSGTPIPVTAQGRGDQRTWLETSLSPACHFGSAQNSPAFSMKARFFFSFCGHVLTMALRVRLQRLQTKTSSWKYCCALLAFALLRGSFLHGAQTRNEASVCQTAHCDVGGRPQCPQESWKQDYPCLSV